MASNDAVPVGTLLLTVFEAISEVFILCFAGLVLSWCGITDKATQRKLNVINVSLFTPALLFSKVAYSLTPSKLKEMWIVPIGFVLITGVSAAAAWVLAKPFGLTKSQRAFAMCAAMFQNSNSLVIALVQSMVYEVPGLHWGEDDTKDQMLGRALTYLLLYSTLGMMLRWSWGVRLLAQADEDVVEAPEQHNHILEQDGAEHVHVQSPQAIEAPNPFAATATRNFESGTPHTVGSTRDTSPFGRSFSSDSAWHPGRPLTSRRGSNATSTGSRRRSRSLQRTYSNRTDSGKEFLGLPEQPRHQRLYIPEDVAEDSSEDDEEWGEHDSLRRRSAEPPSKPGSAVVEWLKNAWSAVSAIMTVPMYAAILSMIIALIPPLQAALKEVEPLERAIKSAGQCSIPLTMVVLGAFFYTPPDPSQAIALPTEDDEAGRKKKTGIAGYVERFFGKSAKPKQQRPSIPGENKTVFVAVVSRMIIAPLILIPIVALIARWDSFEAAEDPVFILSAILLITSPPALTLAQLTQAASGDSFERLISKTISWSYAVLTPPLTLAYAVIGLICAKL